MAAFQFEERDGVGVLTFDVPDQKINTFSQHVLRELSDMLGELEKRTDLKGLLFHSGKPGQFIAGADLNELGALVQSSAEDITRGVVVGHELFDRVSRLPFPTVALIDGACMGGGTELILSMDARIASDNPKTKIGLPETKIGLYPAWGGTQRLPRWIGISAAIEMICSGAPIDAAKAVSVGLVFDAVPAESLVDEGTRLLEHLRASEEWTATRERIRRPLGLSDDQMNFTFAVAEAQTRQQTKGHYPAPLAALRCMREGVNRTLDEGLEVERDLAPKVFGSPISAHLIGVFFKTNRVARDPGIDLKAVAPRDVGRMGVLGAGQMGAGIATAHARSGIPSVMVDVDDGRLADGMSRAQNVIASRIKIGRAEPRHMAEMLGLLNSSLSHQAFSDCDVVVEAIVENEDVKKQAYQSLAPALRDDAILATNTSTISITRLAESAPEPERFVGMHFFFPVDRMALVEVIRGEKTSDETVATIVRLAQRVRKTPIVVNDCAGFLVNRILMPYMAEAVLLLAEGASMDAIDKAATRFGMPMGPIALHDLVGIDVACFAGHVMGAAYRDRAVTGGLLDAMVAAGRLGKKSGAGFRKFVGKKSKPADDPDFAPLLAEHRVDQREHTAEEITERLFLTMLLEAVRALEEGIVSEPTHVDMGLILGIGFPPFRGGVLGWCDELGAAAVVDQAEKYAALGKRYEPSDLLRQHAQSGELFYPLPKLDTTFGGPS